MTEIVKVHPPGAQPDAGVDGGVDSTLEQLLARLSLRRWSQCAWHARSLAELLDFIGREMADEDEDRRRLIALRDSAQRLSSDLRAVAERQNGDALG